MNLPKVVIIMDGGAIIDLVASEPMDIAIIDYDTEGFIDSDIFQVYDIDVIGYTDQPLVDDATTEKLYAIVAKHDQR